MDTDGERLAVGATGPVSAGEGGSADNVAITVDAKIDASERPTPCCNRGFEDRAAACACRAGRGWGNHLVHVKVVGLGKRLQDAVEQLRRRVRHADGQRELSSAQLTCPPLKYDAVRGETPESPKGNGYDLMRDTKTTDGKLTGNDSSLFNF